VKVFGSAKDLTEAHIEKVRDMFAPVEIKLVDADCRATFDKYALR
jgi:hypothetical protein